MAKHEHVYFELLSTEENFPNPHGPLSKTISPVTIESANSEVCEVYASQASGCSAKSSRENSPVSIQIQKQLKWASLHAAKRFTNKLGFTINKSIMRSIKDYLDK